MTLINGLSVKKEAERAELQQLIEQYHGSITTRSNPTVMTVCGVCGMRRRYALQFQPRHCRRCGSEQIKPQW